MNDLFLVNFTASSQASGTNHSKDKKKRGEKKTDTSEGENQELITQASLGPGWGWWVGCSVVWEEKGGGSWFQFIC